MLFWHGYQDDLYRACTACMTMGRIVGLSAFPRTLVEVTCPRCEGHGYLPETRQECTEPVEYDPAAEPAARAARGQAEALGVCPDCLGFGNTLTTDEDEAERVIVTAVEVCAACAGAGKAR